MGKGRKREQSYDKRLKNIKLALWVELFLTICITVTVALIGWTNLYHEARQYASELRTDYHGIVDGYVTTFRAMLVPIIDKIEEDPSFDDMLTWMQSKESDYQEALGTDIYDGIAFTYKGGYVRSWSYGEYSDYDPNTRPWYQQAAKADGETTVVAPYVTFLDPSYLSDDGYILMSIAQKYNEEISFDLDLKIADIQKLLTGRTMLYSGEKSFLYDPDGYILSSSDEREFAHNIYEPDDVISADYSAMIQENESETDKLLMRHVDGRLQYLYFYQDEAGNRIGLLFPVIQVLTRNFFPFLLIALVMVAFEIYLYEKNRTSLVEFHARDMRLTALADAFYARRVYVHLDDMTFEGSKYAGNFFKTNHYDELYEMLSGRVVDEEGRRQFAEFLAPQVLQLKFIANFKISSKRFMMNWRMEDGSTQERMVEVSKLPFEENGRRVLGLAFQDVTESAEILKDALRQAESASQAKGSFLSNMSHEIRTPLNAIIGYLTIAKDEEVSPEKIMHCVNNSEIAAKHLLQIINDVLDMSSIESGKMKIANEDFDLKHEITDITTIFFQNAKGKGVKFETHIDELEEEWVVGDRLRLNQILMNLLSNAVKFTPENGLVQLNIRQLADAENKIYIQFAVSDTGIGMSEEYMLRLFRPFEQESATTAQRYGGSGLGLSITNNLIAMMGGKIEVKSKQNEGTTFTVTMPFGRSVEHPMLKLGHTDYSHLRALVVDDQKDEGTYVKAMLKRCGVKSDSVTSGADALRRIKSREGGDYSYDLCILDWNMPEMNGVEVATRIRNEFGEKMPIIIATAYDVTELEDEAKAAGVDKVIAKPLFQSTLFDILVSEFGEYDPEADRSEGSRKIDMSGVRIILAEDNEMNMDIAVTMLEKVGITVDQARDGEQAYQLFAHAAEGTYDLILMDIQMPVLNGYEATTKIRQSHHPEAATMPIIAMTANAFAEDVTEALAKGMNAHIAKPINYDKLFELLNQFSH